MTDKKNENEPLISGVDIPVIAAEPDVVDAFNKYRAKAVKDIEAEVDETDEIKRLLEEGRRKLLKRGL